MNFIGLIFIMFVKGNAQDVPNDKDYKLKVNLWKAALYWMISWNVLFSIERVSNFIHER